MIRIITNQDANLVEEIRAKIKANDGYCACAIVKDQDTICMCKEFRDQITEGVSGECHCGLYTLIVEND